jgi:hypothetical protein
VVHVTLTFLTTGSAAKALPFNPGKPRPVLHIPLTLLASELLIFGD